VPVLAGGLSGDTFPLSDTLGPMTCPGPKTGTLSLVFRVPDGNVETLAENWGSHKRVSSSEGLRVPANRSGCEGVSYWRAVFADRHWIRHRRDGDRPVAVPWTSRGLRLDQHHVDDRSPLRPGANRRHRLHARPGRQRQLRPGLLANQRRPEHLSDRLRSPTTPRPRTHRDRLTPAREWGTGVAPNAGEKSAESTPRATR
jgi:hypothetical protein